MSLFVPIFSLKRRQARACFGLGLNLDLRDAKGDEAAQLFGALGDRSKPGEGEPGIKGGERLLLLVVPVVVAADDKERRAALDRIGRFQIGVIGARHRMVVLGGELALRQPQPDETIIGAVGDGAPQHVDRSPVVLGLVFKLGRPPQTGDEPRLLFVGRDAVDQLAAPIARRIGELFRLVFLRQRRRSGADERKTQQRAQHR